MSSDDQVEIARTHTGRRVAVLALITVVFYTFLARLPPVRQSPSYHVFADNRSMLGLPSAANVISSFALIIVGICGATACSLTADPDRCAEIMLMLGLALVGAGSVFYHLHPTTDRLF